MQNNEGLSPIQIFFRNKWVRLSLVIDSILIIVLIGVLIWQNTKVSTLNLNIVPNDSVISINGDSRYQNGQYNVTPGTYNITLTHTDLEPKTFTIDISPHHVASITTFLSDQDHTFNFYKLRSNYSSYLKLTEIASAENNFTTDHDNSAEDFIQRFQESYNTFTTKLPIDYSESTGYGPNLEIQKNITLKANYNCSLTLCIQALAAGTSSKELINQILLDNGFNTEDFQIEYKFY